MRTSGTPFTGRVTLTNAAPGPLNIPIIVSTKGSATTYTLAANERLYVTTISVSGNDAANPLFQLDDGAASPRVLASMYAPSTASPAITIAPGVTLGTFGVPLRAGCAGGIALAKTVEVTINGYIAQV